MKNRISNLFFISLLLFNILSAESVQKGKFVKNITFTGSLKASRSERFVVPKSNSWQVQIKWMPKEGTMIKAGDPVVRFDTSNMVTEIENLETSVRDKKELLESRIIENKHSLLELEINRKKAAIAFDKAKLDSEIPKSVSSQYEYTQKQFELKKTRINLNTAIYEEKVKTQSIKSDVNTLKIEIEELKSKLARMKKMLSSHNIIARTSGPLVYGMHPWERRKFQIGESASISWVVAEIPDRSSLMVEMWVNETEIQQLQEEQVVKLVPDAYPSKPFKGKIVKIANSAENREEWGRIKRFEVKIEPDGIDEALMKSGMSVRCEILVVEKENSIIIPITHAYMCNEKCWIKLPEKGVLKIDKFRYNSFFVSPSKSDGLEEGMKLLSFTEEDMREINNGK